MIGQQLGPYAIDAELGSGAMGKVYRATGPAGRVALKIVHPHLLETPGFFKRFLREAELGKAVRHGNVVRTLDVDALVVDGKQVNYMILEYVQGKSLRALLDDLGTIPEALLREIALQTAAGLAAIHEAGIVHRDLKPENILITDDHHVRIMDLGVAKLQEATMAITKEGQFAGSVLYAAPEQFGGADDVGPPADLYSLGVLLYELATGDNPFRRDDAVAVIEAHLHHKPRRLYERNTDTTRFLTEVVARLLAKEPGRRFESAAALHRVLEEAERSTWWQTLAPSLDRKPRPKLRVRRETNLHGRADDLELLRKAWERAKAGDGNTVWIDGEAGIGKTRLLADFLDPLEDDAHILYGSYPPSGGMGGFSDAILGHFGDVGLVERLRPYLTVTPLLVPAFAALVKHDSPPEGAEPIKGDALNAVGVHLMRGLAAEKPTIWIVDDLHFASKESRGLALSLSRGAEGHRVLLIYTSRPGVPEEEAAHYGRLQNFQRVPLARLGGREIIELLQDAFRSEALAEKLGAKIVLKSDGVPFFIFEMIRGLKEGQFIRQLPDGSYAQTRVVEDIEVPSAVKDLIEGRMRGLSDDDRNMLDVAAVQGLEFDSGLVAEVLKLNRVQVLQRLAAVERKSGIVRAEGGRYRFDQNQIQEVLYASLSDELKSEYHTLLARAHVARCGDEPTGDDAVFLAHHHLRGSRPKEALPHLEPALAHLEKSYRNDILLDLAQRALETEGLLEGGQRVEVLLNQAGCLHLLGRRDEERAALVEAVALADEVGEDRLRGRAQQLFGALMYALPEHDAAQAAFREALDRARAAGDEKLEGSVTGNLGIVLSSLGRHAEAQEHHERHRALARQIGDRRGEAAATGNLGNVFWCLGRYEEAQEHHQRDLEFARELGDRRSEAIASGNLGNVCWDIGRYAEAQEYFVRCLTLARELGDRVDEATAIGSLGNVFWSLGRYTEAQEHYERWLALACEIGDCQGEAIATGNLGNVFSDLGRYAEAREHFARWLALSREIGDRQGEADASGNLGNVCLSLGRYAEAREHFARRRALSREIGNRRGEGYALAGLASRAEAQRDTEGAIRLNGEALALRRELGDKAAVAETLVALGRIEGSATRLDEALALAMETKRPGTILAATIERARLPGGDVNTALAALTEHEERVEHAGRMNARFRLWESTQDTVHLREAKRLLDFAVEHSPEEDRTSMLRNVPLHRDITRAWEEHGEKG